MFGPGIHRNFSMLGVKAESTHTTACRLGRSMLRPYKELGGEQLAQGIVDGLRVGLAARSLHNLADEKLEDAFIA